MNWTFVGRSLGIVRLLPGLQTTPGDETAGMEPQQPIVGETRGYLDIIGLSGK